MTVRADLRPRRVRFHLGLAAMLIAGLPLVARAQGPGWRAYTSADGLGESWISAITIASDGNAVLTHGEANSASILDGYAVRRLPTPGAEQRVYEIGGTYWSCRTAPGPSTDIEIQRSTGDRWTTSRLAVPIKVRLDLRQRCAPADDGRMLVLTPERLLALQPAAAGDVATLATSDALGIGAFVALRRTADGHLWLIAESGVAHSRGQAPWQAVPLPRAAAGATVVSVVPIANEAYVSVTKAGEPSALWHWRAGSWSEVARARTREEQLWGWGGADGTLWLIRGSDRAFTVFHRAGATEEPMLASRVLSGRLHDIVAEPDGSFWLATSLGAQRYGPPAWRRVAALGEETPARAVTEGGDGRLFVLFDQRLGIRDTSGAWRVIDLPAGRQASLTEPHALAWLKGQLFVYLPTGKSLVLAEGDDHFRAVDALGTPPQQTRLIGAVSPEQVWTSTPTDSGVRLSRFDGEQLQPVADAPTPPFRASLRAALLAHDGTLWVASTEGLARRTAGRWQVLSHAPGQAVGGFSIVEVDREIWVGHRTGIAAFDGVRWRQVLTGVESVRSLLHARDGSLWAAAGSALLRYVHNGWVRLGPEQGLPDANIEAVFETAKGQIMVGTSRGLWQWHPEADPAAPRALPDAAPLTVAPGLAPEFQPTGIDRWGSSATPLWYSWHRRDGTWSAFAPKPITTEPLPYGRHDVSLRVMDANFNVAGSPLSVPVIVLRPWYREPFVTGLAALTFAIAVALGWSHVARHRGLERTVAERTEQLATANARLQSDLEAREAAEAEARRLEAQLRMSQKLEAVGQLSGGIAHDFNNLLTIVIGCASLLRRRGARPADEAQLLDEILDAGQRAGGLTRQLLAFSQRTVIELRVLDLNEPVRQASRLLRRVIREDIAFTVHTHSSPVLVKADTTAIDQVLVNLVVNARDAMPEGGQLTISVGHVQDGPAVADLASPPAGWAIVNVSDTGTGIPVEVRDRVFEPFFTTKPAGKGTGLGLATAYGIARQLGGALTFTTDEGAGTTFTFALPVTDERTQPAAAPAQPTPASHGGIETILLVEDDAGVRAIVEPFEGRGAGRHADHAIAVLAQELFDDGTPIDLVLADIRLTDMSGVAVARRALSRSLPLPVLMMSGYLHEEHERLASEFSSLPFVQKPFRREELTQRIREVMRRPA